MWKVFLYLLASTVHLLNYLYISYSLFYHIFSMWTSSQITRSDEKFYEIKLISEWVYDIMVTTKIFT